MRWSSVGDASRTSIRAAVALTAGVLVAGSIGVAPALAADVSPVYSTITGDRSGEVVANGTDRSIITITLRDASGAPVDVSTPPTFSASDFHGTNAYGPCTLTGVRGVWTCWLASKAAQAKGLAITSPISMTGASVTFVAGPFVELIVQMLGEDYQEGTRILTGAPIPLAPGQPGRVGVAAVDADWNVVGSATAVVHFASSDPNAILPADTPLSNGIVLADFSLTSTGSTVTASVVGDPSKTHTSSPVPVFDVQILMPGEVATSSGGCKSGTPSDQTENAPFTITVSAIDTTCRRFPVGVGVSVYSNDARTGLLGKVVLDDVTNDMVVILRSPGTWTIRTDYPRSQSAPVLVGAVGPSHLQIALPGETFTSSGACLAGSPTPATAGIPVVATVRIIDSRCNPVSTTDVIAVTSSDAYADSPTSVGLTNGTGTFSVTFRKAGSQTVSATDVTNAAVIGSTSTSVPVQAGAFAKLQLLVPGETAAPGSPTGKTGTPATQTGGVAFGVAVHAVDGSWNPVSSSDIVRVTSTDPSAVLPPDTALSGGATSFSVALWTNWQTITAEDRTDQTKTSSTSPTITLGTWVGHKLAFTTQPTNVGVGATFPISPAVAVQDVNGIPVSSTASITLTLTSNTTGASLTCGGTGTGGRTFTASAGVATFTGCSVDRAGTYTLTATFPSLLAAISDWFVVGTGVAYKLAFTTQPANASVNTSFPTSPVVTVQDVNGTKVTSSSASVTIALYSNPTGATLTCSGTGTGGRTFTASSGLATFTGCRIDKAGTYTLQATSSGLVSAISGSFTVGGTTASISVTPSASTITWGGSVVLTTRFAAAGANRTFQLWGARDNRNPANFALIATLTTNSSGVSQFLYTPITNLYYEARFAGASDLAAATSPQARVVVRQISILRPTSNGTIRSIARGTHITFTTTVRPSRPELTPASVTYWVFRKVSGVWTQYYSINVMASASGLASFGWTFSSSGLWYVRSMANPTPYNANSVKSPVEQFKVG